MKDTEASVSELTLAPATRLTLVTLQPSFSHGPGQL